MSLFLGVFIMSELVIIAVGLAMDAFAVAICKGLNMRKLDKSIMFKNKPS